MNWSDYLDTNQARFVQELLDVVRIPSVSATRIPDVLAAGEWVMARMQSAGIEDIRMTPTGGQPVVYVE